MTHQENSTKCLRCNGAGSLQVDEPECNGGRTREACERCGGAGWVMNLDPFNSVDRQCTACAGRGEVSSFVGSIGSGGEGYQIETCSDCGGTGNQPPVIYGWIEPQNAKLVADYWLTRRSADSAPGYDLGLPDIRVCRRWNGAGAWVGGFYEGRQRQEVELVCLHGNNGWRIEGPAANAVTKFYGELSRGDLV